MAQQERLPIWLTMFRQLTPYDCTAHWGIFIPDGTGRNCYGIPYNGTLYHASSAHCNICTLVFSPDDNTLYRKHSFLLADSPSRRKTIELENTAISEDVLDRACLEVSNGRPFNITRNCQEWVKEVMLNLMRSGQIPYAVLEEMERHGFTTLRERSVNSWNRTILCQWFG